MTHVQGLNRARGRTAVGDMARFYRLDELNAQHLYNAARNA